MKFYLCNTVHKMAFSSVWMGKFFNQDYRSDYSDMIVHWARAMYK